MRSVVEHAVNHPEMGAHTSRRKETEMVSRTGFEPGTTGLKVHCEFNGGSGFQDPPSPIPARLANAMRNVVPKLLSRLHSIVGGHAVCTRRHPRPSLERTRECTEIGEP
jgi:hypothetical protein